MPTKESIKKELDSVNNIYEILDVMKHMASSQYSRAKKTCEGVYIGMIETIHEDFIDVIESIKLEALEEETEEKDPFLVSSCPTVGLITVTSDQAFMGGLNTKIVKVARNCAEKQGTAPVHFMITGRKGASKMKFNQLSFAPFPALKDGPAIRQVTDQVTEYVIQQFRERNMGRLYVIAAENISFTRQLIEPRQLLPFSEVFRRTDPTVKGDDTYLESPMISLTSNLAGQWLGSVLYKIFLSAKAAEFGALATQMEGNLNSVRKVQKKLGTMYKRARNEKVDASMREIFVSTMVAAS